MADTATISVAQDGYDGGTWEFNVADLFAGQDGSGSYWAGFRFADMGVTDMGGATAGASPFIINITDVQGTPSVRARMEAATNPGSIAARSVTGWTLTST